MSGVKSSREGPSRLNGTTQGTSEEGHTPKLGSKLRQATKLIRPGTKGARGEAPAAVSPPVRAQFPLRSPRMRGTPKDTPDIPLVCCD